MNDPLEYQILADLQAALRGISVAGGYHHDVTELAVKLDADATVEDLIGTWAARPFIILELLPETFSYFPGDQIRIVLPFAAHFINDSDPTTDAAMLLEYLKLAADVEKALSADGTRGGLATDTKITARTKRAGDEGRLIWATVVGQVLENRTYGSPNG